MVIKGIVDEDFVNYKKPSMFIIMPYCDFKCDKEAGCSICQNSSLVKDPFYDIEVIDIIARYIKNPITQAIVLGGLEPFESKMDFYELIHQIRKFTDDDIVIYTGYTEEELIKQHRLDHLLNYKNIIIKFGRFIPNQEPHYDEVLGVKLASDNQYARRIS